MKTRMKRAFYMKKIEKLSPWTGQKHVFQPSDARDLCQYCGEDEEGHEGLEKLSPWTGQKHVFQPSDARDLCQYCGEDEEGHEGLE